MIGSRKLAFGVVVPVLLFAALQLVPYGRAHKNPPDGNRVVFDSPATEALARRGCFDCHSNATKWLWYSHIAPLSWRIQQHVDEGREKLNFSAFDPASEPMAGAAGEAGEAVQKGEMPPADYLLAHPEARLTAAEKQALVAGLERTFASLGEGGERGRGRSGEAAEAGRAREDERGADLD